MKESEIKKRVAELVKRLPPEVVRLRRRIRDFRTKAKLDETTNGEARRLRGEAASLASRLRSACNHLFLAEYPGYRGSYSYDYDDSYAGSRACLICGAGENGDDYETLILRENGLVLDVGVGSAHENYRALEEAREAAASEKIEETLRRYVGGPRKFPAGVSASVINPKHLIREPAFYRWHGRLPKL